VLGTPLVVGVAALFSLGLGLFQLLRAGALHGILEYDDGVWFGSAVRLVQGVVPYRDFVLDQPPGVPLLLSPVALMSQALGTAGALSVARVFTVVVEAVNVVLVGRLVRHRSWFCVAVACAVMAVYPAAVVTSRTVMLEPYCDLWCLLGLLAAFDRGHLSVNRRRAVLAGAAFGSAGACKAFALIPFVVLIGQYWSWRPARPRLAAACAAGAGAVFCGICAPFVAMSPGGFVRQVILTQLVRGVPSMSDRWARAAQLLGVPPAPASTGVPDVFEGAVVVVVGALACLALVATWRAAREPAKMSLDRYAALCPVLVAVGLSWPAAFYYHYAAFLGPFLALPMGMGAEVLRGPRGRSIAVGTACALMVVGGVHAVRVVQTGNQPGSSGAAWVASVVPKGGCAVSDNPAVLLLADRFRARGGCTDLVDSYGSTLAWSGGRSGSRAALQPSAVSGWLGVLRHSDYVVLTGGLEPGRIPWGQAMYKYLEGNFRFVGIRGYLTVWARLAPSSASPSRVGPRHTVPAVVMAPAPAGQAQFSRGRRTPAGSQRP
jgi:hypothetical protein